ncbi:hypothetical protein KBD81_01560 [Candidatus Woesebacteria bacterium]|nr:hypothetical protein [Candidatus Woesebacteria bacterium]
MLNLNSLMIGTMQPKVMAAFYELVIGKEPDMEEEGWYGWQVGASFFGLGHHSKMEGKSKEAGRVMYNFETPDVKGEFARIKEIPDAVVVKEPYEMGKLWIATFADPDGNYFQLMSPWS